jgi:hypothetical protein
MVTRTYFWQESAKGKEVWGLVFQFTHDQEMNSLPEKD